MHLLSAQPGGYQDDEGIIDLNQTPADIVILAAADGLLQALAIAYDQLSIEAQATPLPSLRLANWLQIKKPAAYDLYEHKTLAQAQVIVLSLLGGEQYWPYGLQQLVTLCQSQHKQLIVIPGDDTDDSALMAHSTMPSAIVKAIWHYFRQGGSDNYRYALNCLMHQGLGLVRQYQPPEALPNVLIYLPIKGIVNLKTWREQATNNPRVLLLFYKSHCQSGNLILFDDYIALLKAQGFAPLPVAITSLKEQTIIETINYWITTESIELILNTTGFASQFTQPSTSLEGPTACQVIFANEVPVVQLIIASSTESDWQSQSQGLRPRDVAMQVVLPEMDGRIISYVMGFKAQQAFHTACQIDLIQYALLPDRAQASIVLAKNLLHLRSTSVDQLNIGLILANYPTQDSRIGNGVGLDTPNSVINILQRLKAIDFSVDALPQDGDELIHLLCQTITNNLDTIPQLRCWQSVDASEYWQWFIQQPESSQEAVIERWGYPDQDPKYREGRIMVAGIRLGKIFVGIQPARGYNMDLQANYHDPDLVPPHSYLAFYYWLKHDFNTNALVHVGKHGNLEWLPGKGVGLSQCCWPDLTLQHLPNVYPFIVNDPGEGAQAKRRTHAVIIDHLMPPLSRADTYGALFELESLVDEYYQAMSLDSQRQDYLKSAIVKKVKQTHLLDELPESAQQSDAQLLEEIDTYLCDIKEAQIRQGLHVFGELPDDEALVETLIALVRLPRGNSPEHDGILHNLVADLALLFEGDLFDPFMQKVKPWEGARPAILAECKAGLWRTTADTIERLAILSQQLLIEFLFNPAAVKPQSLGLMRTQALFEFIADTLLVALRKSAQNELDYTVKALRGQFIPAGPSGAPSRGRLDVLPTGRNFYSVDNRSIPSATAWILGQKSADELLHRHLQEQGEYPQQLAISVWGTATMRTGGDDIAQAFALMGVKPIWAAGSDRVIDIEVIPAQLLNRPRVDVTLRVSGFFRDAFLNVMMLFDTAVKAVLKFDDPGDLNPLRAHFERTVETHKTAGFTQQEAETQAGYRVFGSKPGAYGAGLQGLIDEKCWKNKQDLMDAYVNFGGYAYASQASDGVEAKQAFKEQLKHIQVVVQNQDNREHDILDSDDYYQFQGGLTNAVSELSGSKPQVYLNDHSNPERPVIRTLKEEINRVLRSRVLNPKWIEGMQKHGYKGAFEMAATLDYLFAYDATTDLVDDYQYEAVMDTFIRDEKNHNFIKNHNPQALMAMTERLLEAIERNMWQAKTEDMADLISLMNGLEYIE